MPHAHRAVHRRRWEASRTVLIVGSLLSIVLAVPCAASARRSDPVEGLEFVDLLHVDRRGSDEALSTADRSVSSPRTTSTASLSASSGVGASTYRQV